MSIWGLLSDYSFLIIALGTSALAIASSIIGSVSVLKGQSLIGDAIGHASFPGIVLAFMLTGERNPWGLFLGAVLSGALAFFWIQLLGRWSKIELETALAAVLSTFFGLGMVLKSYITGNPAFSASSQAGLEKYIFGQASYMMQSDVIMIYMVSIPVLILFFLFYKELKLFVFDPEYAITIGINEKMLYGLVLIMTMGMIGVGLKLVGIILISSLLIIPTIIGLQWSDRYAVVLIVGVVAALFSAVVGTLISSTFRGMSTGPMIVVLLSLLAIASMLLSPRGAIRKMRWKK